MSSTIKVDTIQDAAGTHTLNLGSGNSSLAGSLDLSNGGVYLGGTSSANYLSDYEEGEHTLVPNTNLTLSSSYNTMKYTKIGNLVTISGYFLVNAVSGSNVVTLSLPFTPGADPTNGYNASVGMVMHSGPVAGDVGISYFIYKGLNYVRFYKVNSNAAWSGLTNSDLAANDELYFTANYYTDL